MERCMTLTYKEVTGKKRQHFFSLVLSRDTKIFTFSNINEVYMVFIERTPGIVEIGTEKTEKNKVLRLKGNPAHYLKIFISTCGEYIKIVPILFKNISIYYDTLSEHFEPIIINSSKGTRNNKNKYDNDTEAGTDTLTLYANTSNNIKKNTREKPNNIYISSEAMSTPISALTANKRTRH